MVWYGMVFIYSTSLYIIYIAHHYNITQDAEREMHRETAAKGEKTA